MVKVKICGITDLRDALKAYDLGADFVGFIFTEKSPRVMNIEKARVIIEDLPLDLLKVGLFLDQDLDMVRSISTRCHLNIVQLHGEESPQYCARIKKDFKVIKVFKIEDASSLEDINNYDSIDYCLLDTYVEGSYGGTGRSFNWDVLIGKSFKIPIFLAGGLTPANVGEAINKVRPYAVDVTSGVEKSPGKKDYKLLREFIDNAKKT